MRHLPSVVLCALCLLAPPAAASAAAGPEGYYRFPDLHGKVIVFSAEGDLWKVGTDGGAAQRLTTHAGLEGHPAISPDGTRLAFSADYEGPTEVYLMPLAGGLPQRLTWQGANARVLGWTPAGAVLYSTAAFSTLPSAQLASVDPAGGKSTLLPLAEAADGTFGADGETLYFTRYPFQGSYTKRYKGGTAQGLWVLRPGAAEAEELTGDYEGTSRAPMLWQGRLYFASDRDGWMNLWSMLPDGSDPVQHTEHEGWDVKSPDLDDGRIVYQLGADLHLLDLASGEDRRLPITLATDFDQRRERWIDEPMDYLTSAHLSPSGDRVALTARGQVFVTPAGKQGRRVEVTRESGVRYRGARFLPRLEEDEGEDEGEEADDGEKAPADDELIVLSDESGEVELWTLSARGVEAPRQLTDNGETLRLEVYPSPDGRHIAFIDKNDELWIYDRRQESSTRVAASPFFSFRGVDWSPDGRYLAYSIPSENYRALLRLYDTETGDDLAVTSERFNDYSPAFSPDGEWLYFLSDRHLVSLSSSPWGIHSPQPLLDGTTEIYQLALVSGKRSPFAPATELDGKEEEKDDEGDEAGENGAGKGEKDAAGKAKGADGGKERVTVRLDREGLAERLFKVPAPPGNYLGLSVTGKQLYWLALETGGRGNSADLMALAISRDEPSPVKIAGGVSSYELSADQKKMLLRKQDTLYVVDAGGGELSLDDKAVPLSDWSFPLDPQEEWRQMFVEAWRLARDYFYDPGMHGVDWPAVLEKYLPLVDRVADRWELADLFGEMIGELSALHSFVGGGDFREGDDEVDPASLGALLERDEEAGGYRVTRLWDADPEVPEERSPLSRPGVEVGVGDVIAAINGVDTLSVADPAVLLRNQAGRQVLLAVLDDDGGERREVIVEPISPGRAFDLRYDVWEHERRLRVEELGDGKLGYVHLRAMGRGNYSEWARHYFPVWNRQGLVIDLRHNRGGNIDSWILGQLLRRPWMWWKPRTGVPYPNMQLAFNGHLVVLVDAFTASDGEAFAEGFRRLGLGKVIGVRSWGGEIWLTASNRLVDAGVVTAAEFGVYGPEGAWLIEGHGVEPDIVVDNLPHATFGGEDAQLEAAVEHLLQRIAAEPPEVPEPPPYPDLSLPPR